MSITIKQNNTPKVVASIKGGVQKALEESGLIVENAAKGLCPVDTGRLRNSITHSTNGNTETIGSNVEYATYVEMGTSRRKASPYLRPGLENSMSQIEQAFKRNIGK